MGHILSTWIFKYGRHLMRWHFYFQGRVEWELQKQRVWVSSRNSSLVVHASFFLFADLHNNLSLFCECNKLQMFCHPFFNFGKGTEMLKSWKVFSHTSVYVGVMRTSTSTMIKIAMGIPKSPSARRAWKIEHIYKNHVYISVIIFRS